MDLTLPQLCSNSVRPGRCLSASSFTGRANLVWNLEGIKPWLKIEVFVTGQGDRNVRILPNHLPGCQRSSSLPLAALDCLEFAVGCRQAAKGPGEMNMCTEKWPAFICCDRNGAPSTTRSRFPQPWDGEASAGLTKAVQVCINLLHPLGGYFPHSSISGAKLWSCLRPSSSKPDPLPQTPGEDG